MNADKFGKKTKYGWLISMECSEIERRNQEITQKTAKIGVDKKRFVRYTLIIPCDTEHDP